MYRLIMILLLLVNVSFGKIFITSNNYDFKDTYYVEEGETFLLQIADLDATDIIVENLPDSGVFNGTSLTWTPKRDESGNYSIVLKSSDSNSIYTDFKTVKVLVFNNRKTILANQLYTYTFTALDPEDDPVEITITDTPPGSTWEGTQYGPKTFSWIPTIEQIGIYVFIITVTDNPDVTQPGRENSISMQNTTNMLFEVINPVSSENTEIVFSDINNDNRIDIKDFSLLSRYWMEVVNYPVILY
jgi:hypothetical protein